MLSLHQNVLLLLALLLLLEQLLVYHHVSTHVGYLFGQSNVIRLGSSEPAQFLFGKLKVTAFSVRIWMLDWNFVLVLVSFNLY